MVLKRPEPRIHKSKVMNKLECKTSKSKASKGSQPNTRGDSRPKTFKPKVLNNPKPYFTMAKVKNHKNFFRTKCCTSKFALLLYAIGYKKTFISSFKNQENNKECHGFKTVLFN